LVEKYRNEKRELKKRRRQRLGFRDGLTEVWAAVKQRLNVAILKAVLKETFESFEALKTFFNKTYCTHTRLYQRMERWSSTSNSMEKHERATTAI
jgi:hypothetical protein